MKKIILFFLVGCILSGCSFLRIHKTDVEQGNMITAKESNQLHIGMSEAEVKSILGTPVLMNVFSPARVDYVYTLQKGYGDRTEKHLICIFYHHRLQSIQKTD